MAVPLLRPLSLGEVLDVSFGLYRRHAVPLLGVALVTQGPIAILNAYNTASGTSGSLFSLLQVILAALLSSIGLATTTFIASDSYLGREVTARGAFRRSLPLTFRVLLLAIVTWMLIIAGAVLLIIPGIIVAAGLAVSTQVLVLEKTPSVGGAMGRSWALSKGLRWKVFVAVAAAWLLVVIPAAVLGGFYAAVVSSGSTQAVTPGLILLMQGALSILIYPFFYTLFTVIYYDMRVRKEGFDLEMLADALAA